jgi:hypothetical protein
MMPDKDGEDDGQIFFNRSQFYHALALATLPQHFFPKLFYSGSRTYAV